MPYTYEYPRAALTVDCVVFAVEPDTDRVSEVLLVKRGRPPFAGAWALPGGFLELDETLAEGARRELREETGLDLGDLPVAQLAAFDAVDRDPRERVLSVAHVAFVQRGAHRVQAADDASEAAWFPLDALPPLAFDHGLVIAKARSRFPDERALRLAR